jgi:phosphoglycolate phosphatase-like HAD superfamily hydrolase
MTAPSTTDVGGGNQDGAARRLLLWDVDGTLVSCGPAGREALEAGARLAGGLDGVPHVTMGGKTDPQIMRETLELAGVDRSAIDGLVPVALEEAARSLAGWRERMAREGHVHPGVERLLGELAGRPGVRQTLLTGNLAVNAAVKVGAFGLDGFFDFPIGAYGDDHEERERLVPVALRRAGDLRGETYLPEQVWVIGDTARDLACARAGGVRCLIVGTGQHGFEAVRDLEADAVVEDLGDTARVLEVLLG